MTRLKLKRPGNLLLQPPERFVYSCKTGRNGGHNEQSSHPGLVGSDPKQSRIFENVRYNRVMIVDYALIDGASPSLLIAMIVKKYALYCHRTSSDGSKRSKYLGKTVTTAGWRAQPRKRHSVSFSEAAPL
jgi:hypothetical protein